MSNLLNQMQSAATSALNTAANVASSAATTTSNLASQALNSDAAKSATAQASTLTSQAANAASNLAGQAHAQAHSLAPGVVPAPGAGAGTAGASGTVDKSHDLNPQSETDKEKLEKLYGSRSTAEELQDKNILKGQPNDSLAGKKADLEKSMLESKLNEDIAQRPNPEDLVKRGILSPDEAPVADKQLQ